ncbi:MAG: hypothetical protein LBF19_00070 [Prevotellaceae bacterium]|nr:hypothetical protein [Prevotellaceae bacterium]
MKRILSILFIATAICNLAVFSVVPHHHHEAVMCAEDAHCRHDNTPVRNHTDTDIAHCTTCTTASETTITTAQSSMRYRLPTDGRPLPLMPVPAIPTGAFANPFHHTGSRLFAPLVILLPLCRPADTDGLRAPPANV